MAMSQDEKDFRKALRTQGLNTEPVDSSWIRSATYEPVTETLILNLITDITSSPGSTFNNAIRDSYAYVKLF